MKREEFPALMAICVFFATDAPHKRLLFNNKWREHVYFNQIARDLAWILITSSQSECTEKQKECARRRVRKSKAKAQGR
jgi:transcription initiation factor IIF auxiliary subunit